MKPFFGLTVAALTSIAPVCAAQTIEAIEEAEEKVLEAWDATPLTFRQVFFVSEEPVSFGVYTKRPDNVFKQGEPLIIYTEPVGYAWRDDSDGKYAISFAMDLALKKHNGQIIGGKENFAQKQVVSKGRPREFMLFATINISGIAPGDYIAGLRVRDLNSDEAGVISLPFTIAE